MVAAAQLRLLLCAAAASPAHSFMIKTEFPSSAGNPSTRQYVGVMAADETTLPVR